MCRVAANLWWDCRASDIRRCHRRRGGSPIPNCATSSCPMSRNSEFFGNRQIEAMRFLDGSRRPPDHRPQSAHNPARWSPAPSWNASVSRPGRCGARSSSACMASRNIFSCRMPCSRGARGSRTTNWSMSRTVPEMAERLLKEANGGAADLWPAADHRSAAGQCRLRRREQRGGAAMRRAIAF